MRGKPPCQEDECNRDEPDQRPDGEAEAAVMYASRFAGALRGFAAALIGN